MKQIIPNYIFNAISKTVTLPDFTTVRLDRLQLIVNTTKTRSLYNFADSTVASATISGNVITLSTVGSASSSDKLQIIYDCASGDPTYDTPVLPSGASIASKQDTGNTSLASIDGKITAVNTGAVVVSSSALPIGAATAANQTSGNTSLASIATNTANIPASPSQDRITALAPAATRLSDGTSFYKATTPSDTQPVSGTVTANAGTNLNTSALALETGGNLAAAKTDLDTIVANTNKIPASPAQDRTGAASPSSVRLTDGTSFYKSTTPADTQPISASSLPLPSGAATSANQSTANTSLASIVSNTANIPASPAQDGTDGTGITAPTGGSGIRGWLSGIYNKVSGTLSTSRTWTLASGSDSVTTVPSGTQTISGTVTANAGTNLNTSALALESGGNLATTATNTTGLNNAVGTAGSAIPSKGVIVQGSDGTNARAIATDNTGNQIISGNQPLSADAQGVAGVGVKVISFPMAFNDSAWDRVRGNEAVSLLSSASRTTTQTSADIINYNGATFTDVILDVTSAGTGSITLSINGKDPASGKYYMVLSGAAVTSNSTNLYKIGPGLTAVANSVANAVIPRVFQIVVTANNSNAVTYSVGYNLTRGR